jgi:hypothetical protein
MQTEEKQVNNMFVQAGGQCINDSYTRIVSKETNEEGRWKRLMSDIEVISQEFGVELDDCLEIFESVSCSKKHLKMHLAKQSYTSWNSLDDMGLKYESSLEYELLVKVKGIEEVERRKKFLNIE